MKEYRPSPIAERVDEILTSLETEGWYRTRAGRVAHYDTGEGVALCLVGHLVRRAEPELELCARCSARLEARRPR